MLQHHCSIETVIPHLGVAVSSGFEAEVVFHPLVAPLPRKFLPHGPLSRLQNPWWDVIVNDIIIVDDFNMFTLTIDIDSQCYHAFLAK